MDVQIRRLRGFAGCVLGPIALITAIKFPFYYDSKPAWLWPFLGVTMFWTLWRIRNEVRDSHVPKKKSLEALREKPANAEPEPRTN